MCLTVYFDGQFWVGVFEEEHGGELRIRRRVFGAEPTYPELLKLIQEAPFSALIPTAAASDAAGAVRAGADAHEAGAHVNPKRLAREAARDLSRRGVSTRSQEALRRQREEGKKETHRSTREQREGERKRKREIAQAKALKRRQGH